MDALSMRHLRALLLGVTVVVLLATGAGAEAVAKLTLKIEGMTPTGCSSPSAIRGTTMNFPGVRDATVSLELGEITLEYESGQLDLETLIPKVERACKVRITRPPHR